MVNHPHLCHFCLQMFNLKNNVLYHPLCKMLMWQKQKYYRQSKQFSHKAHYVLVIVFLSYLLGFLAIVWLQNRLHLQKQMQLFHKFWHSLITENLLLTKVKSSFFCYLWWRIAKPSISRRADGHCTQIF